MTAKQTQLMVLLQDLVLAAVNEALRTANETMEREMGKLTGGLNMPGLF